MPATEILPQDIDEITRVFPASVKHLMPPMDEIPEEYQRGRTEWNRLVNEWFFCGIHDLQLAPKPGIDKAKALRHIKTIMGSYEPKHEHKEAACAYLFALWFDAGSWVKGKAEGVRDDE